jgi:hypothetical protein
VVAVAVVGVVFLVAGAAQLVGSWSPVGDFAVAELVVRRLGRWTPLSGPYSAQRGYDHPLPLVYVLQGGPYWLSGGRSSAGLAAAVWWHGAMACVVVWVTGRREALALGLLAVAALPVMATNVDRSVLVLPWNPDLALVSALAFVFVAWRVAVGERWLLPLASGLAVWCVGAHLGYAPFVGAIVLAASASLVGVTRRRSGWSGLRALVVSGAVAVGVALVLASPALVDVAGNGRSSNPARIVDLGRGRPGDPTVPSGQAVKVLRAELAVPPAWAQRDLSYDFLLNVSEPRLPVLVVPLVLVVAAAWRRRAFDELAGVAVSLAGLGGGVAGLVGVHDRVLQPWYLYPAHVSCMALVAFVSWSAGRTVRAWAAARHPADASGQADGVAAVDGAIAMGGGLAGRAMPRRWRALRPLAVPLACGLAALFVVPTLHVPGHYVDIARETGVLARSIERRYPAGSGLVVAGPVLADGYYSQALALQLDRAGLDVRVPDSQLYLYSRALAIPEGWKGTTLVLQLSSGEPAPPELGDELVATLSITSEVFPSVRHLTVWERPTAP